MSTPISYIVIQENSTRDMRYVCGFPTEYAASAFRSDCGMAGYRTSEVIQISPPLRDVVAKDDDLLDALMMLLTDAINASVEVSP